MSELPLVAVVILNWNGKSFLERFLSDVVSSTYPNLRVIVADNASTDKSVDFIKAMFSSVEIIENTTNEGFAKGYNSILSQIKADYFVLLNSDVAVTPGWIEPVIALMESDKLIAAAQPKIRSYHHKNMFEYAGAGGGYLDMYGYAFCRGRIFDTIEEDLGQYDTVSEIFWASGAALFVKSTYWHAVGGFDARFFAHMEEIDLCWRLKNRGLKVMYCPQSVVFHIGGGTLQAESPIKTYLNFRNNLFMLLKNADSNKRLLILFIRFWLDFVSLLKYVFEGKFRHAMSISKAHQDFFKQMHIYWAGRSKDSLSFNRQGFYSNSIVWQYFIRGKKKFTDLVKRS